MFYRMTMNMGAVAALRRVKNAISVARYVLEHTQHSLLVGDLATQFALSMGLKEEPLETNSSHNMWQQWKENDCQPNFWVVCKIQMDMHEFLYWVSTQRNTVLSYKGYLLGLEPKGSVLLTSKLGTSLS